jgi:N-acetylmuramoyl-L-alanine amidase
MGIHRPSNKVIIGGTAFDTDAPIVNFREGPRWDATSVYCIPTATEPGAISRCKAGPDGHHPYGPPPISYTRRYSTRPALRQSKWRGGENAPYDAVKGVIKQFVIHHDGCASADMCFNVLQNERGLSCHFLIDNDGTIYQTIDLALMAYHAGAWNSASIGVELCNRGDAKKEPGYYASGKKGPQREAKPCKINGHTFLAFDYTKAQYDALEQLSRALLRLLPNLPAEFPQSSPGVQNWDTLPTKDSFGFSGFIGHYHLIPEKWDPGYFDFKEFCGKIRGQLCFPVFPRGEPKKGEDRPLVPREMEPLKEDSALLYKMNEARADGGFFPVGPWGESRLWHGGVHLAGKPGDRVFSPFPGRLVAARMGAESPIGSVNFLLIRHLMTLGTRKVEFFSHYMHLADELKAEKAAGWTEKSAAWKQSAKPGQVVLLDEPIEAGATIGRIGTAGPADLSKTQIHVEIFAASDQFQDYPGSPWDVIDGSASGRFCDAEKINGLIDTNKDDILSKQELSTFYAGESAQGLHYMVTFNVSEWTAEPSWADALNQPKDFKGVKKADLQAMVDEQITPGLWWDEKVALHARLPPDGVVYHYHPVTFVSWFNQQMVEAAQIASKTATLNAADAKEVPKGITDDRDGEGMLSASDTEEDPCNARIQLKEIVEGYEAAPECAQ